MASYDTRLSLLSVCQNVYLLHICANRHKAISVETGMGSLDSKNFRAPGKHLKATGLEESVQTSLSVVAALALQKEPACFLDVLEMLLPFPPLTCFSTPMLLLLILDLFFLKTQRLDHLPWRFPDSHLSFDFLQLPIIPTKNTVFNCILFKITYSMYRFLIRL